MTFLGLENFEATPITNQAGFTLVELLVGLVISSVIAIAALSALVVSRQGFTTVDSASQLRDSGRFATDIIQRLAVQSGYKDFKFAAVVRSSQEDDNPVPEITGFNNALVNAADPTTTFTVRAQGSDGYGSDILILRFQTSETFRNSNISDNTMIDCLGNPSSAVPGGRDDRMVSILHVAADSQGEQSLMCTTVSSTGTISTAQPLVRGVENFQVLYGVDGVTPNASSTAATTSVATSYLRADQMVVPGDVGNVETNKNWRRVRSLRIGMVLRGPVGSTQDTSGQTYYPFGLAIPATGGTPGAALSSSDDPGTVYGPVADRRLRHASTFTVYLRNLLNR